jgi:hypothetical protein
MRHCRFPLGCMFPKSQEGTSLLRALVLRDIKGFDPSAVTDDLFESDDLPPGRTDQLRYWTASPCPISKFCCAPVF